MRPAFMWAFNITHSCSGPHNTKLAYQAKQNVVHVRAMKKGGFKVPGAEKALNPNEKPLKANGYVISSWSKPGSLFGLL